MARVYEGFDAHLLPGFQLLTTQYRQLRISDSDATFVLVLIFSFREPLLFRPRRYWPEWRWQFRYISHCRKHCCRPPCQQLSSRLWPEVASAAVLPTLVTLAFCGIALVAARPAHPPPQLSVPDNTPAILEGCVVDPAMVAADREHLIAELAPQARAQVSLFSRNQQFPELPYGTKIEIEGKVRQPHNYQNPRLL